MKTNNLKSKPIQSDFNNNPYFYRPLVDKLGFGEEELPIETLNTPLADRQYDFLILCLQELCNKVLLHKQELKTFYKHPQR